MTLKEAWQYFEEKVLCDEKNLKILIGVIAFIWFVLVIYTARHPKTVQALFESWAYFTLGAFVLGTGGVWIGMDIAEKLKIDNHLESVFKWLLFFGLGNWALFMICGIAIGSVLVVIEMFGV